MTHNDVEPSTPRPEGGPAPEDAEDDRDFVEVRESWVGDRPSGPETQAIEVLPYVAELPPPPLEVAAPVTARPVTVPPPLPPPSSLPAPADPPAREELVQAMLGRLAASDYDGALRAAESVLRADHRSVDALQARELCRAELRRIHVARLGNLSAVPRIAMSAAEVVEVDLDARADVVLARVDGLSSIAVIAATTRGVPEHHALRILSELFVSGVLTLASDDP